MSFEQSLFYFIIQKAERGKNMMIIITVIIENLLVSGEL